MSDDDSRLERGNQVRREVLGDAHVDRSLAQATDFSRVVQEYVTASCWGDVWSRGGLDRRTRSLVNLAMLTALNRPREFQVHVRGAIRNGCTEEEIQEVLLQTAAYCGAPAALESFRLAERTLEELRQEAPIDGEPVAGLATGITTGFTAA
ncbi:carboxymuconolactone decarboxylase family protein [Dactylosporangium sp. CA-092794]|uniref:carboxymuconolactone decarboxylase family protein n=1 Tax=Dactylosporangium sp. CA-092794 TaxID=3239929 RepID=UPI003D8D5140